MQYNYCKIAVSSVGISIIRLACTAGRNKIEKKNLDRINYICCARIMGTPWCAVGFP